MRKVFIVIIFFLAASQSHAQTNTPEQYIAMYKDLAIQEMKRMGVPAAITLAQGILESECGNSVLVKKSNNHFGIKCKGSWTAGGVTHDDDAIGECFRKYDTPEESFRDHSNFLRASGRYSFLFKLDVTDYKAWAIGLKKAGYATNPRYPDILIKNIEQYNLQQYTLAAVGEVPNFDASKYQDDSVEVVTPPSPGDLNIGTVTQEGVKEDDNSQLDAPDKKIYINTTKCVLVKKGVSLLVVATKNDINLNKMLEFNELAEDGILGKDQYIYLQKKPKTGDHEYHIVQPGETLYDVAQKNGIQLQYLLEYNQLDNSVTTVAEGTKLFLRPGKAPAGKTAANKPKMHTVAAKEGLYGIAKKYNVTVQQLKEWNNLDSNELHIGQELIVGY
jgi:LysM repeat protein